MSGKKKNPLVTLLMLAVVVGIGFYAYDAVNQPDAVEQKLMNPNSALKFYMQAAWDHMHGQANEHLNTLKRCVTEDDWNWYYNNYDSLYTDFFDIGSAINPSEAEAVKKMAVMRSLLSVGPNRPDATIVSMKESGNTAQAIVSKLLDDQTTVNVPVTLVKEGEFWKVKDWAGGRSAMTGGGSAAAPAGNDF